MIPRVLTIAGSDSSGGAGIQADLKTFSSLKVYGMSVVTAITAQNTVGVTNLCEVDPEVVTAQIDAVMTDIPTDFVKTGMLASREIVEVVAEKVRDYGIQSLVVDPIMFSGSGTPLLGTDGIGALRSLLVPLSFLITPNLDEAGVLSYRKIDSLSEMEDAACRIYEMGPRNVLVKGGHLGSGPAVDVFFDGKYLVRLPGERVLTSDAHGTGCVLSAAITAYLARGLAIDDAVRSGKTFVTEAIRRSLRLGQGPGPCDPVGLSESVHGQPGRNLVAES